MTDELLAAIAVVKNSEISFCKFISPNDAGITGAHQAGFYIPKNSTRLIFDVLGEKGSNMDRYAQLSWFGGVTATCRFIYYGQGTRNEYRITRLGKVLGVGDLVVLVKETTEKYLGFLLKTMSEKEEFLRAFDLKEGDTNKLITTIRDRASSVNLNSPSVDTQVDLNVESFAINFKPKAHILVLLGEELIKSPVMAIYELIKNGYDADARSISVLFHNIENIDESFIEVTDSGTGISAEVLKNVWFEPGTDYRKPVNENGVRTVQRSPIYHRIPMGEKGVGRFAVHKLGNKIQLISRPASIIKDANGEFIRTELLDYEVVVNVDWRRFSQSKYLDDVIIEWEKRFQQSSFMFPDTHGTYIKIEGLKEEWTRGMARQLKKQTVSMLSPKNDPSRFSIHLDFGNWWLQGMQDPSSLLALAPYKLTALVDENYNMTFDYSFFLSNNTGIGSRRISSNSENAVDRNKYESNVKGELKPFLREYLLQRELEGPAIENILREFDEATVPFGSIMLELFSFDLDSDSLKDITTGPKAIRDLLREHSGIKVFKGDLRVYDYGDPGNDWLGLDLKRIQNKEWFSNNQVIGYVYLDPEGSGSLVEKTNREGFIENTAYENFLVILEFLLTSFMVERQSDRQRWLMFNKKAPVQNSFADTITGFRELISTTPLDDANKTLLLDEATRVEEKYNEDKNALLIPAGVGMTASFAMHEIEKLIPRMQESVKEEALNREKLQGQVKELKDYAEGLLSVLKRASNVRIPVVDLVKQAIMNYSSRMKARKIAVYINPEESEDTIVVDKRLIITVLMNVLDNSIYWLDTVFHDDKGIYINILRSDRGVSVMIVDNGPGFKENTVDIIRPYYTRKMNGIGIGMYLVDTIMIQYGRLNIIHDRGYLLERGIPERFKGAAIELIFNKQQ